ncbi:MAG: bifunctional folylpolyglutamate synthase/dihydrofolate synthase, partial [Clostridia bacterium]|nr:bifunctional folylpolyglutamate synthase/dihydrofolate synthase [Clostridia bacterium]
MTYQEALSYIHSRPRGLPKPGLERIEELLSLMGDPHKKLKYVHVAGTNGKGSSCAMLSSILRAAGYKTGLYTSPFIHRFNERMQINGKPISDSELAEIAETVRSKAEEMSRPCVEFENVTA